MQMNPGYDLLKNLKPTLILVAALVVVGVMLYYFTDSNVFWPGYISMIVFYALIFLLEHTPEI